MSLLSSILSPDNVHCGLDIGSKAQLFEEVGRLFENKLQLPRKKVIESLVTREKLGSTGLGFGFAIPHGRIKGLQDATSLFFKLRTPIPFDAPDSQPVNLLFILLVPAQATDLHLEILGELAQMFSNRQLREKLLSCDDPAQIYQLLTA